MLNKFNQVKLSSVGSCSISEIFSLFKLSSLLLKCKINKSKGHSILSMLFSFLLIILENSNSVQNGILKLNVKNIKTPINDMLNNHCFHWRNLLYSVAKQFSKLCPTADLKDNFIAFDDTTKKKSGKKTDKISWFYDHSKNVYFKGFQNVTAVWSNGKSVIPVDFEFKIGKKIISNVLNKFYPKGSHIEQRVRFAKEKKTDIVIRMIKRIRQRRLPFKFILWDSWYNCSKSFNYIFDKLIPEGKVLISMLKNGNQKYRLGSRYFNLNELYTRAGKWFTDPDSGIKYKYIYISLLDAKSNKKIEKRSTIGLVKICFFKYPKVKKWKAILCTDIEIHELDVLKMYLKRWSIECIFKDIRQYFGYDQSKSSNYSAMVADLTIRYVFYIMFCHRKEKRENIPMGQILFDFYQELYDSWLTTFVEVMFKRFVSHFIDYAIELGYTNLIDLKQNIDKIIIDFFEKEVILDKITEADKSTKKKIA